MRNIGITMYRRYVEGSKKPSYFLDEERAEKDAFKFLRKCDKKIQVNSDFLAYYFICKDNSILDYSAVYYQQFLFTALSEDSISGIREIIELFIQANQYAFKEEETVYADPDKFIFPTMDREKEVIEGLYGSAFMYTINDVANHFSKIVDKSVDFKQFVPKKRINN